MDFQAFFQRLINFIYDHRKSLIIGSVLIVLVIIIAQFGIIRVTIDNPSGDNPVNIGLLNQSSLKTSTAKTGSSTWKIVRRGTYEVSSIQDRRSSFSLAKVRGFLLSTSVHQKLASEDQAEFVGYNPDACVYYNNNFAVSWGCIGSAAGLVYHEPPVNQQATFNNPNPAGFGGTVEALFTQNGKTFMLLRERAGGEQNEGDEQPVQVFYELDSNYRPVKRTLAKGLDSLTSYQLQTMDNGFLVYDIGKTNFYKFKNVDDTPSVVKVDNPDQTLQPTVIHTQGDKVYVMYTNYVPDNDLETPPDIINRIVVTDGQNTNVLKYDGQAIDSLQACSDKLCILRSQNMGVYEISGDSLKLLYNIKQVDSMTTVGDTVLLSKPSGTLDFNVNDRTGHYGVINSSGQPCGIRFSGQNNYIVCTQEGSKNTRKSMLNITVGKESANNILLQVKNLESKDFISAVSVYKGSIIISPNYGERSFDETTGTYRFNPETVKSVTDQVKAAVSESGIDTSQYKIRIIPVL